MATGKVAISINTELLAELDEMVAEKVFASRSQAIQVAVQEKVMRMRRSRLAEQCAKIDRGFHLALAEEGMDWELEQWPEY